MKPFLQEYLPLPLPLSALDYYSFLNILLDASSQLAVYREKIADSKLDSSWFLPTLQQKEATASTKLEGTQATLDGVLLNQIDPKDDDKDLNEVTNYLRASAMGMNMLRRNGFSDDFLSAAHRPVHRKCSPQGKNKNRRIPHTAKLYRLDWGYSCHYIYASGSCACA